MGMNLTEEDYLVAKLKGESTMMFCGEHDTYPVSRISPLLATREGFAKYSRCLNKAAFRVETFEEWKSRKEQE